MHSCFSKRGALIGGLLALALVAVLPGVASAVPEPGAKGRGFRLFARSLGAITVNRVYCGLATTGEVCVDSNNSSTIGGGFWPKGTPNQYVFNSGLQIAGIIDPAQASNPWAGDTTGGFFFDPKGTTQHGLQVEPIYNSQNPEDFEAWPDAAFVPSGDAVADLYFPLLQGRKIASQGDVWWISWEGNPGQAAGRPHPLGIAVEQRGMGWNYPSGNEDIIYFTYTFYNITSLNPDDYAAIRPGMREIMLSRAADFHALNNSAFGIDLPDEGYTITDMYAAFAADMDVGDAGENYSSVHLPFALGNTYETTFAVPDESWEFDPGIFAPPFFPGVGFVGVKYLKSPSGAGEIQLFSNTINGGAFGDPRNTTQLWRYLSGNISASAGDANCDQGPPTVTRLCYINNSGTADMRFFQSSTELTLGPGEFGTIVVAYIFAAPVAVQSFVPGGDNPPGDPLRFANPAQLNTIGANMVDSLAGFLDYTDLNTDGIATQNEYVVVPGSLLGKALVAQEVFDNKFLLPFAPDSPEFFLVPGDDQVSVLWRPSASEATGDAFFAVASQATTMPAGGGAPEVNPLYDPNYRQNDVEGYRVYRGRVDAPNSLTLLAQFDYAGTVINDFTGSINPVPTCAPDIGVFTDCPADYDPLEFAPGVTRTVSYEVPLTGQVIQVKAGGRAVLADSTAFVLVADTAVTGGASGFPALEDGGVPFFYVDHAVRNNFRYFYSVTAFDFNSFASGPSSLESPRITRSVTPTVGSTNSQYAIDASTSLWGRGVQLTDNTVPTLDPATGVFSKAFPPANGWDVEFAGYVQQLVSGPGSLAIRLDSIQLGSAYNNVAGTYFVTINPGQPSQAQASYTLAMANTGGATQSASAFAPGAPVNPGQAANFGVDSDFSLSATLTAEMPGDYWVTVQSRGCVNGGEGFTNADEANECSYNGSRWFDGDVETAAHPTAGNMEVNDFGFEPDEYTGDFNNAGTLAGVTTIYEAHSYTTTQTTWRNVEGILGFAARAADIKVYWGAGGVVDSVIDVTHNVPVPFDTAAGGSWGFVSPAGDSKDGRPTVVSLFDFGCVYPVNQFSTLANCGDQTNLEPVATLHEVIMLAGSPIDDAANTGRAPQPNPGFLMYIAGHVFSFEMPALPADGTVWTMRSYTGGTLTGGQGEAGDEGPYEYHEVRPRPFTAIGAELRLTIEATNTQRRSTLADLGRIHTVPDPYYVSSAYEQTVDENALRFVNLPSTAVIRIYSSSGVLVDIIEHTSATADGSASWDVRSREGELVASGVYFYHIESGDARRVGRFTVVRAR